MPNLVDERKILEILIVDDDRIVRILHRSTLERCDIDHPITTFSNAKEALDYLRAQQQLGKSFLVLLDINMPVMNGWEFLEECHIAGCDENVFTVMVSSSINIEDKIKAQTFPQILDFLEKPSSPKSVNRLRYIKELEGFFKQKDSKS